MLSSTEPSKYKIIGKGKYGCVIKPALKCINQKQPSNNTNTISKITNEEEAKREHSFMSDLREKDPELKKYILSSTVCIPEISDNSYVRKKNNNPFKSIFTDCNFNITALKARLLQMNYGGPTMQQYVESIPNKPKTSQKKFLQAISKIIHCLELFQKYNVMHCDIKLANILYNEKSGDIKIIDFGLAHKIDDYKNKMRNEPIFEKSDYQPPESQFSRRTFEDYFKEKEKETKHKNCECLECQVYQGYTQNDYETFLDDSVKTFDSYSLAIELQDMFEFFSDKYNYYTNVTYACKVLMVTYCDKSVKNRSKDLGTWKRDYEQILEQYNDAVYVYDPTETYLYSIKEIEKKISNINEIKVLNTLFRELDKINKKYKTIMNLKEDQDPEHFSLVADKILLQHCIIKEGSESEKCKKLKKKIAEAEQREADQRQAEQRQAESTKTPTNQNVIKKPTEETKEPTEEELEEELKILNGKLNNMKYYKPNGGPNGGKTKRKTKLRTRNKKLRSNKKRRHGKKTYKKRKTTHRK